MSETSDKRIVKNTFFVYLRLFVVTVISLVSTRFVLQALGASDFGLYNIVGSIITMLNIVSVAMCTTTRRFLNVEMGKPNGNLNKIFNLCLAQHIVLAFILLIIAESLGLWYIHNYLNVSPGKINDAYYVFHISTIVACIGIVNVPYQSVIEAYEKFSTTAKVDIIIAIIKLLLILSLLIYDGNKLRYYAIIMCVTSLCSFLLFHGATYKIVPQTVKLRWYFDKHIHKKIVVFNAYTALGAFSYLAKSQGVSLLINAFFGTIVNAAFAIGYQIQNFVNLLINNLSRAAAPQITQNFGSGNYGKSLRICSAVNKYTIIIMGVIFFTLQMCLKDLMNIWLVKIPEGAILYTRWILLFILINSFSSSIPALIQASGNIRNIQLVESFFELIPLPISYIFFKMGYAPQYILIFNCISSFMYRVISLFMMKTVMKFNILAFVLSSYLPAMKSLLCMAIVYWGISLLHVNSFILAMIILVFSIAVSYLISLTKSEKEYVISLLKTKFK